MSTNNKRLWPHARPMMTMSHTGTLSSGTLVTLKTVDFVEKPTLHVSEKASIVETMEVVELVITLVNTIYLMTTLGLIRGLTSAVSLLWKLPKAIEGINKLPQEIVDIDEDEKNQLITLIKDRLVFADDVESVISMILDIIFKIKLLTGLFRR